MNKTRRRFGKARRRKSRLIHELRNWTKTNYVSLPKRGRLRLPAKRLADRLQLAMLAQHAALMKQMAPVLAFMNVTGGRADSARKGETPKPPDTSVLADHATTSAPLGAVPPSSEEKP